MDFEKELKDLDELLRKSGGMLDPAVKKLRAELDKIPLAKPTGQKKISGGEAMINSMNVVTIAFDNTESAFDFWDKLK